MFPVFDIVKVYVLFTPTTNPGEGDDLEIVRLPDEFTVLVDEAQLEAGLQLLPGVGGVFPPVESMEA